MAQSETFHSLTEIIDTIEATVRDKKQVSIENVFDALGRRSFGPIITFIGLILVIPGVSDIPSVPSILGVLIILITSQIILQREHIWLPNWLLRRSVGSETMRKTLTGAKKPARHIDRYTGNHLRFLVENDFAWYLVAACCLAFALATPLMEFVPFSANVAGLAIFLYGLALIAEDGILLLLGLVCFCTTAGLLLLV